MTARTAMESIKANAELTKQTIQTLKDEVRFSTTSLLREIN